MARLADSQRKDMFLLPPERLTLVTDKEHPLYDPRVENPPDENMVANIAMNGVLEPILVRKNGDAIEVIAGRGRTKAALEVNRRFVAEGKQPILMPMIVKGGSDADLFGIIISENEIRREDTMIIKGGKARKLLNMGYTVAQIAVTFGVTRKAVETWLATDELPQPIKNAVEAGEITATAALQLAGAGCSREEQVNRFDDMKRQGHKPTVANVRSAAASAENKPVPKVKKRQDIKREIENISASVDFGEYEQGYKDALLWVLGQEAK